MYKPFIGWGVNVQAQEIKQSNIEELVGRIKALRFEWIRFEFDFREIIDQTTEVLFVQKCHEVGIKVLGLLNCSVPGSLRNFFLPELSQRSILENRQGFMNFVNSKVDKYGGIVSHWEVYNEPNTKRFWVRRPNPNDYMNLLKDVAETIRRRQGQAKVVFGGLLGGDQSSGGPYKMARFFQKCVTLGTAKYFDISNFHPYSSDCYVSSRSFAELKKSFIQQMNRAYTYAKSITNKPVWFSEFGIASRWVRMSQSDIAEVYWSCYQWCRRREVPLFLWSLHNMKYPFIDFFSPENSFGLLDSNLKPTKTYLALQQIVENGDNDSSSG